jgi:hypothetical protein
MVAVFEEAHMRRFAPVIAVLAIAIYVVSCHFAVGKEVEFSAHDRQLVDSFYHAYGVCTSRNVYDPKYAIGGAEEEAKEGCRLSEKIARQLIKEGWCELRYEWAWQCRVPYRDLPVH